MVSPPGSKSGRAVVPLCLGPSLKEAQFLHQVADDFFLILKKGSEILAGVVDVHPTIACAYFFPLWGVIHLGNGVLVGRCFFGRQTRCAEKAAPVDKARVDALLHHGPQR